MAENWGTKSKELDWNVVPDTNLVLSAATLGYDPTRRAHLVTVSGVQAGNTVKVQVSIAENDYVTLETLTGSTAYVIRHFDDVNRVVPPQIRLVWAAGGGADPGVAKVRVESKHLPTTMRRG